MIGLNYKDIKPTSVNYLFMSLTMSASILRDGIFFN